ncbi:GMC family oxidoreductase [Halostella sp. JP-L12]|uniref:GMC family oxidoreductase n=1 Tax=Halostella TaxID=1843185 RepID=UPI000EF77E60|nr:MULTISPECIES: GMC family oxidoreductase [Halostella]NHN46536.1 GMC family oxidoreductase [Halostella sp. JP-L12]
MTGPDDVDRTPVSDPDVCIVGAGPAGALLAHRLATAGIDVVVLEAGPRFDFDERLERMEKALRPAHPPTDVWEMGGDRDRYTNSGEVVYPLNTRRVKGIGGSSLAWGARLSRFHEKDFEMGSRYGLATDWPISYDDLQPYYAEAERALGVAGPADNPFSPPRENPPPMDAFAPSYADSLFAEACESLDITMHRTLFAINSESYDGRSACQGYGTCSPVCPSGAKYSADHHIAKAEAAGATVIDRAAVQRLKHDATGERIERAVYATPTGETYIQSAETFVLAAGGVEIPRLLLLSRSDEYPDGLANSSGLVGKYFMERPTCGVTARIDKPTRQHLIGFGTSSTHQFYDYDEDASPPPGSFKIEFKNIRGPRPSDVALTQQNILYSLQSAFGDPFDADKWSDVGEAAFVGDEWGDDLLDTIQSAYGNHIGLSAAVEGIPRRENQITLDSSRTDDHGNPVPNVSWTPSSFAKETMDRAFEVMDDILDALDADVLSRTRYRNWKGIGHHMGTTRMSEDPEAGVVDPDCRTHEIENLYIASSSVFVTSGALQPTLTIAALALRLADKLEGELR